jgi:hypothetical protein
MNWAMGSKRGAEQAHNSYNTSTRNDSIKEWWASVREKATLGCWLLPVYQATPTGRSRH